MPGSRNEGKDGRVLVQKRTKIGEIWAARRVGQRLRKFGQQKENKDKDEG